MDIENILSSKKGHAFMHLEEQFWIAVLTAVFKETKGHVVKSSEILGITPMTVRTRSNMYGIDINSFRDKYYVLATDELKKEWLISIKQAISSSKTKTEAAKKLGWNHSTLYNRMRLLGVKA